MKDFVITYTTNGTTIKTTTTTAKDYTKAYLNICYVLPLTAIIISVIERL